MRSLRSCLIFGALAFSVMPTPALNAQSLVHLWALEGDFSDTSGSGNNGVGTGTFIPGRFGQGLQMVNSTTPGVLGDGVDTLGVANNLPINAADNWSMNFWLKVDPSLPLGPLEYIAGFGNDRLLTNIKGSTRAALSFHSNVMVDPQQNDFHFWGYNIDVGSGVDYYADNQWHMYTITYNGALLKMYRDGILEHFTAPPAPFVDAAPEAHIGNPSVWNNNLDASIDEFGIFSGALSSGQIGGLLTSNSIASPVEVQLSFTVNRSTGQVTLANNTASAQTGIVGYRLASAAGALKPGPWDTIAGRFDGAGDMTVDNDNWQILSSTGDPFSDELSEAPPAASGGGVMTVGKTINFGPVWARTPFEDLQIEVDFDNSGVVTTQTIPATYTGNGGAAFEFGDLNADGDITPADWTVFRTASSATISAGALAAERYLGGDLDSDGDKDIFDFDAFAELYEAANGPGSFAAMLAIPEPSALGLILLSMGVCAVSGRNRRYRRQLAAAMCGALVIGAAAPPSANAALVGLYQFNGDATETTGDNVDLNLFGDAGFAASLHPGLGQALSLDGAGDGAIGQDFVKIQTSDATVVAWVYATSTDGNFDSIVKQWGDVRGQFHLGLGPTTADTLSNEYGRTSSQSTSLTAATPNPFPLNAWVHVAFTLDSTAGFHRLYVNGDVVASAAYPGPGLLGNKVTGANPRGIGIGIKPNTAGTGPSAGAPGEWAGYIDEVGIYDHALTEAEIEQIIASAMNGIQLNGVSVPEPSSLALILLAGVAAFRRHVRWRRWAVVAGCVAMAAAAMAPQTSYAALNGLYQFNGNANETTGANINLNLIGDADFIGSVHPGLGLALSLDGNGDGAIGPNFNKIQTNDVSVVAWVHATSLEGAWDQIASQWSDVRGQFHFSLGPTTTDTLRNEYGTGATTSVNLVAATPNPFPTNQWVHVAFVVNSTTLEHKLYVNGDVVATGPYAGTLGNKAAGSTSFGVGAKPNNAGTAPSAGAPGYWNGYIDEVGIFDHALTEANIEDIIADSQAGIQIDGTSNPYLRLRVDRSTGDARLMGDTSANIAISAYQIGSEMGSLQAGDLDPLGGNAGFPVGNGTGNGWETDGANGPTQILEAFLTGSSSVNSGANILLGDVFAIGGVEDLSFQYRTTSGDVFAGLVEYVGVAPVNDADFDGDGDVDGSDFLRWQRGVGTPAPQLGDGDANGDGNVNGADLNVWKSQFGMTPATTTAASVPEPASGFLGLFAMGFVLAAAAKRGGYICV